MYVTPNRMPYASRATLWHSVASKAPRRTQHDFGYSGTPLDARKSHPRTHSLSLSVLSAVRRHAILYMYYGIINTHAVANKVERLVERLAR